MSNSCSKSKLCVLKFTVTSVLDIVPLRNKMQICWLISTEKRSLPWISRSGAITKVEVKVKG